MKRLDSIVEVANRFQRSVNILNQLTYGSKDDLQKYQLLPSGAQVLESFATHLLGTNQRAFTITGPYGTGKSSLGFFICSLLGKDAEQKEIARDKLKKFPELLKIVDDLINSQERRVVALNGRNSNLSEDLNELFYPTSSESDFLTNLRTNPSPFDEPTLLVVDEIGRYISSSSQENCALLQEFSEFLNSGKGRTIFVGILHQNFSAYAETQNQKEEWGKVQGRFVDIPLISYQEETLKILSSAIVAHKVPPCCKELIRRSSQTLLTYLKKRVKNAERIYKRALEECWPINPVVSLILGPLSRKSFWQNNRSIYNFLTSKEPFGFQEFLSNTSEDAEALFSPEHLWDYLYSNYQHLIVSDRTDAHRWINAEECIDQASVKGNKNHVRVIKTIAVISLCKAGSGLETNMQVLEAALPDLSKEILEACLADLSKWKLVKERVDQDSFLLFDSSTFDIEQEKEKYKELEIDTRVLNNYIKLPPLSARKHYAQTGNLRLFNVQFVLRSELRNLLSAPNIESTNGTIYLVLDGDCNAEEVKGLDKKLKTLWNKGKFPLLIIGFPNNASEICSTSQEILILKKLLNEPLLEGDRAARLEIDRQIETLVSRLREEVNQVYHQITWLLPDGTRENTTNYGELNVLISKICDVAYQSAPILHNELVNRQKISGNIRAAQKRLVQAMVLNEAEKNLGFQGTPPEMTIFLTLFARNGLHKEKEKGNYSFVLPTTPIGNAKRLREVWTLTQKVLKKEKVISIPELYELWDRPPFGIKNGIKPILLVYFFIVNKECLSFYEDDVYIPTVGSEVLDLLLGAPKHIKLRYHEATEGNKELVGKLFNVLKREDSVLAGEDPLSVARSLVKIILSLPKWVQTTSRASSLANSLRSAVLKAHDPMVLLFTDLPKIFGTEEPDAVAKSLENTIEELRGLNSAMLSEVRQLLYKAIDASEDLEKLRERAKKIYDLTSQLQLKRFIGNISEFSGTERDVEKILGLASGKMIGKWTDLDVANAKLKISGMAFNFRHLEGIANLSGKDGSRRLFGLVLAGKEGRDDRIVDIPNDLPSTAIKAIERVEKILKSLPEEQAIAVLIESGLKMEKRDGR